MGVPAAYLAVVLIWSTTPLAIQWSTVVVGYEFGVAARMVIGLAALLLVIAYRGLAFPWHATARRVYLVGGGSVFLAMSLVYWSAQYIPSGWVAVIFGLTPIVTSVLASTLSAGQRLSGGRLVGLLLGFSGLLVIFSEGLQLQGDSWKGICGVLLSVLVHSLGSVWLQRLKPAMPPVSITAGSLTMAVPLFTLNAFLWGGGWPDEIPRQAMLAILYLGLMGSALGFPLYYFLLGRLPAERVALVTLMTPVLALILGAVLNQEFISQRVWLGTALIVSGLAHYEYGHYLRVLTGWRTRWRRGPL